MIKLSFDFDDTLARLDVQEFALLLQDNHPTVEQWIVTSRMSDERKSVGLYGMKITGSNDDLFEVAEKLNIPKSRIVFTELEWKSLFFKNKDFMIHLDDYPQELELIRASTKTFAINVLSEDWREQTIKIIKSLEKSRYGK